MPPVGNEDRSVAEGKAGTAEPEDWHTGIRLWPKLKKNVTMIPPAVLYPHSGLLEAADVPLPKLTGIQVVVKMRISFIIRSSPSYSC